MIFRKKYLTERKICFNFICNFVCNISCSKNWERYYKRT